MVVPVGLLAVCLWATPLCWPGSGWSNKLAPAAAPSLAQRPLWLGSLSLLALASIEWARGAGLSLATPVLASTAIACGAWRSSATTDDRRPTTTTDHQPRTNPRPLTRSPHPVVAGGPGLRNGDSEHASKNAPRPTGPPRAVRGRPWPGPSSPYLPVDQLPRWGALAFVATVLSRAALPRAMLCSVGTGCGAGAPATRRHPLARHRAACRR